MIFIQIEGDKSFTPELWQIYKHTHEYVYSHLESGTYNSLEKFVIDVNTFVIPLPYYNRYEIILIYGEDGVVL